MSLILNSEFVWMLEKMLFEYKFKLFSSAILCLSLTCKTYKPIKQIYVFTFFLNLSNYSVCLVNIRFV